MDEVVFGNMAWNAGLVTIAGFLIKRWMGNIETQIKNLCDRSEDAKEKTERQLEELNNKIDDQKSETDNELKDRSKYFEQKEFKLYQKIDGIYEQLKIANRRTAKAEEQIHIQAALCAERTKHGMVMCMADNKETEV